MSEQIDHPAIEEAGVVMLIDPNKVNTAPNHTNAIPDYEDMHVLVNLTARRRGRTVLMNSSGTIDTDTEGDVSVNMMGINNDEKSPNYGSYTSNWHDMENGMGGQTETFGITQLNIKTNTSYIPQISIEFTDIRGYSFFNNQDSPYRILFDFPPPLFTLTVKGYYGKALTYLLHLVKYTSEFNSAQGNYVINAEFIGITYAPLTDVLFRYALNFGIMRYKDSDEEDGYDPMSKGKPPINTYDFILKIKHLYHEIKNHLSTIVDVKSYEKAIQKRNEFQSDKEVLNNFKRRLSGVGEPYLFLYTEEESPPATSVDTGGIELINNFNNYNEVLKKYKSNNGIPSNPRTKLYLGFYKKTLINEDNNEDQTTSVLLERRSLFDKNKNIINSVSSFINGLNYKRDGFSVSNSLIELTDVPFSLRNNKTTEDGLYDYMCFDLTDFYIGFFNQKNSNVERVGELADRLNENINQMIYERLGMIPTIYNIFEIISNDVDYFFKKLIETSRMAEIRHNNELLGLLTDEEYYKDSDVKIYPFPLLVDKENIIGSCEEREIRMSPKKIENKYSYIFPEMDLVREFIETFKTQNRERFLLKQRTERDERGQNIWIPLGPLDSAIISSSASPYLNVLRKLPNARIEIFRTLLTRYYVLTQFVIPVKFAVGESSDKKNEVLNLMEMYGSAEGANLVNTLIGIDIKNIIDRETIRNFKNNITGFYETLKEETPNLYSFDDPTNIPFVLSSSDSNYSNIYKLRDHNDFRGLEINTATIGVGDPDAEISGSDPINKYLEEYRKRTFWDRIFFRDNDLRKLLKFSTEKILLFEDHKDEVGEKKTYYISHSQNINYDKFGRYYVDENNIVKRKRFRKQGKTTGIVASPPINARNTINETYETVFQNTKEGGNFYFWDELETEINKLTPSTLNTNFISFFLKKDREINNSNVYDFLFNENEENEEIKSLLFLSLFGNTLTPFNNVFNMNFYSYPIISKTPAFVIYYMGLLSKIIKENKEEEIYDFIKGEIGRQIFIRNKKVFDTLYDTIFGEIPFDRVVYFNNGGFRIVADITDIKKMSIKDREKLIEYYDFFYEEYNNDIIKAFKKLVDDDEDLIKNANKTIEDVFFNELNLIVFSDKTFFNGNLPNTTSVSINQLGDIQKIKSNYFNIENIITNDNNNWEGEKEVTNKYFESLFNTLYKYIEEDDKEEESKEKDLKSELNDDDVETQTYYSFKNINDKWLSGIDGVININENGYPFITNPGIDRRGDTTPRLINAFAFVDRTMNPIGDTIIDPEILMDIMDSPDTSIFTAMSQILSVNGFEFFPLQNFMSHDRNSWLNSFKIDTSSSAEFNPIFVCMYIGGGSTYPTTIEKMSGGDFKDDGIIDLINPGVSDFSNSNCNDIQNDNLIDNQKNTNKYFPYRQVRAFRVRFGEQDQSMFNEIKIEGNEFPETNESIQILSRIAGDNKMQAPIPKGQNLYNLYENRAYSSTITTLGNVMIQPSQYYQLENIPLFNGAYIILNVEHTFTPNHATTTFEGTKILRYPIPRVLEPHAVFGFEGGTTAITDRATTILEPGDPIEIPKDQLPLGKYLFNPTHPQPLLIRSDSAGDGRWGTSRDRGSRSHMGIDFITTVGQEIKSPIAGRVQNFIGAETKIPMLRIYPNNEESNEYYNELRILYVHPPTNINYGRERTVKRGDVIGIQLNLQTDLPRNYSNNVTPHIHVELWRDGKRINPTPFFNIERPLV